VSYRLVFFGSSTFGLPSLESLLAMSDVTLVGVVSQPAKPVGRKAEVSPTPVAAWAQSHGIPVYTPDSLRSSAIAATLTNLKADTFVVAAYGLILPQNILDIPEHQCLNIHASLLPKYRGASPIAAALLRGDNETGISFMLMDPGVDTGPVLEQHRVPIITSDTTPILEARLAAEAADHLASLLENWWNKKIIPQPQSGQSSYAPMLQVDDGRVDWSSAVMTERKIRAYQPWPGVWTMWNGQRLKIISAEVQSTVYAGIPGLIMKLDQEPGWGVVCQDGLLIPHLVQLSGKKPVAASTLPGSYPNFIGSRFD